MLRKRTEVARPSLNRTWCRDALNAFADKMVESGRAKKAALNFEYHLSFFRTLDNHVEQASDVTAERLIALFELDGLRRASLMVGALVEKGQIASPMLKALREAAELQKQEKLLAGCTDFWFHDVLCCFYAFQTKRLERYRDFGWVGKLERYRRSSVTQDLKAAKRFLEDLPASIASLHEIQRLDLDTFLSNRKGYRAAVGNFITYLRTKERLFHKFKISSLPARSRLANLAGDLKIDPIIECWVTAPDRQVKYALGAMLMLTYAQPGERIVRMKVGDFKQEPDGNYLVKFTKVALPLDDRIAVLLERHLETRPETAGDYLFPGRRYGAPMSESSLSAYITGFNVTAANLFTTGLFRMFVSGIRQPQVMVKGLGVSHGTAAAYLEAFDARFIDEAQEWMKGKKRPLNLPPTDK